MEASFNCTKRALKRDPSVPIGTVSPMHVDCVCGKHEVPIVTDINQCPDCKTCYDKGGWIVGDHPAHKLTAYKVIYDDGTSYVTSMAKGIDLQQARDYFIGTTHEQADETTFKTVVNVELAT